MQTKRSARQPPADCPADGQHLNDGNPEQFGIERLLAGLVPKDAAPGKRPQRPAEEGKQQQGQFRNAVLPPLRLGLVQPERRKGDEVDRDEGGGDVGGGEEGN